MQRLAHDNINTSEEYGRIFKVRAEKEPHWADLRRWETLVSRFQGGSLIDLGCLDSKVPEMAKDRFPDAEVHGLDFVPEVLEARVDERPDILWKEGDLYQTGYPDGFFDYAVLGEVIEHLESPALAVQEAVRLLRPGGVLALSTPLNEAVEPGAVDGDRHLWSFTREDIIDLLLPYGTVETLVLRSQQEPEYKYAFPVIVAFMTKK